LRSFPAKSLTALSQIPRSTCGQRNLKSDYTSDAMISKQIDRLVERTKWLAAGIAVATLPFTIYAWGNLLNQCSTYPVYSTMFVIGVFLFVLLARTTLAQSSFAIRLIGLERNLTQSVFAFAMSRQVVGYGKNQNQGSRVGWLGRGNWVMLAAPYFVPTATIVLWLLSLILFQSLRSLVLGFGVSYHLVAVLIQCKIGSSELRRLGRKFCWMFLPAINLLVAGCIAAFALNGFTGVGDFLMDWIRLPRWILDWLISAAGYAISPRATVPGLP